MKKFLMLLVLSGLMVGAMSVAGCTTGESFDEHARRLWLTTDLQARQVVEDWDYIWLYDRNNRANRWDNRIGY